MNKKLLLFIGLFTPKSLFGFVAGIAQASAVGKMSRDVSAALDDASLTMVIIQIFLGVCSLVIIISTFLFLWTWIRRWRLKPLMNHLENLNLEILLDKVSPGVLNSITNDLERWLCRKKILPEIMANIHKSLKVIKGAGTSKDKCKMIESIKEIVRLI